MFYNPEARYDTIEICVNPQEKSDAKAHCKALGIGLSTWYRGLGNAELQRHGKSASHPKESRHCPGVGRPANRAGGAKGAMRRHL
jgi:hypothetical protein